MKFTHFYRTVPVLPDIGKRVLLLRIYLACVAVTVKCLPLYSLNQFAPMPDGYAYPIYRYPHHEHLEGRLSAKNLAYFSKRYA